MARQFVRDGVEDLRALMAGLRSPLGRQRLGRRDGGDSLLGIGDLFDAVLAWVGVERFLCPLAVGAQGRIRVRLVGKTAGARGLSACVFLGFGDAILGALRAREGLPALGDGGAEVLLLIGEGLLLVRREERVEEVLGRGVLLEAAHEVGHGDVEVLGVDDRGVENLAALEAGADGLLLGGGHALEHLRVEHAQHAALGGELIGHARGEEVVRGDADAHGVRELRAHDVVKQAVVVRVDLRLVLVRCDLPTVDLALDVLHGEVRALDDADLDGCSALGDALNAELRELLQGLERIRQVGLEHDAGLEVVELRLAEQLLEEANGEVEVVVFLHVQVDKDVRAARHRGFVERTQTLLQALDRAIDIPRIELRHHRRRLDGDVRDLGVLDERQGARGARAGLVLAEDGLAEKVEVQVLAGRRGLVEHLVQGVRLRVEDQVAHHLTHAQARERHDEAWEDRTEEATQAHERAVDKTQEARVVAARDVLEGISGHGVVLRAHDAVDEVHGEVHAIGIPQQAGELLGSLVLLVRAGGKELVGAGDGGLDDGVDVIGFRQASVRWGRRILAGHGDSTSQSCSPWSNPRQHDTRCSDTSLPLARGWCAVARGESGLKKENMWWCT